MAYRLRYSDYSSNGMGPPTQDPLIGPPGPAGPPGPPGPQGIPGPAGAPGGSTTAQSTLALALTGSTATGLLMVNTLPLFLFKVQVTTDVVGNYTLQLLNGNGGAVLYESTGINATLYNDVAGAYIESTTDIWARLTQIDPVSLNASILVKFLATL